MKTPHQPVLLQSVCKYLAPQRGDSFLDATAGYGGHAAAILDMIGPKGHVILVDRDANATKHLSTAFGEKAEIIHASFLKAAKRLKRSGIRVDRILLDLGVSSPQIDNPERGFSFRFDAPLDMRMDQAQTQTAADVVNGADVRELERILRTYGEEPRAHAVAQAIVAARPIHTTMELSQVVRRSAAKVGDIDKATRTFQALRIETNDELGQLEEALPILVSLLKVGGRIGVISFHSLEDRIVKQFFNLEARDCICPPKQPICTCSHHATLRKISGKPITADPAEIALNPRSRSAKLRVAEKQKPKGGA